MQIYSPERRIIYKEASCEVVGSVLQITTPPEQGAYALEFPPQDTAANKERKILKLRARVHEGAIGVSLLSAERAECVRESQVTANGRGEVVEFLLPATDTLGSLILRNRSAEGRSRADVEFLGCSEAEALVIAGQIHKLAKILASLVVNGCAFAPLIADVTAAAEELRPLLGQGGLSLIRAQPHYIENVFATLDVKSLFLLVDHLKILRPLGPEGEWYFSKFQSRGDLATLVRYSLWNTLHQLAERPSLAIPWHAGTTLITHFDNDLSLVLYVDGSFEPNEFSFLDGLLKPGMRVIDAGANEGVYTVFLASKVGPTGRVIAIEPSSRERERLQANIAINKLTNIAVVPSALADRAGQASLKIAEAIHAGQNTIKDFVHTAVRLAGTEIVSTVTLDHLVAAERFEEVDVIKLDIEGAETLALAGAKNTLRKAKPLLLLEISPPSLTGATATVAELLVRENYRLFCFNRTTGLLAPYSDGSFSDNIVAVHRKRDWGLLPPES